MDYIREGCAFSIPDRPTVRHQMEWYALVYNGRDPAERLVRNWEAAKKLIIKWECASMPDLEKIDPDQLTQPSQTSILMWVGTQVWVFMDNLEDIPKNF